MSDAVVVGGTGFLGEAIADSLSADTLGRGGDADVQADILLREDLGALKRYDVVVNCVGLSPLHEPRVPYRAVHVYGVKNMLGVMRDDQLFVHVSALGADAESRVQYLRTKGRGEEVIGDMHENSVVLRPDVLYDADSEAWRRRVLDPITFGVMPDVRKTSRPVHRFDVADAVRHVVEDDVVGSFDLYGDTELSVTEMVRRLGGRSVVAVPEPAWYPLFYAACELRLFGLSRDQRRLYNASFEYEGRPEWFIPRSIE